MKVNTKNNKRSASSEKLITENWGPMIERTTGVKDPVKLEWMSQLAHNTAKHLNEDGFVMGSGLGAANNAAPGMFGGVYSPYATLYNTPGIGDPVPAGRPALTGADYADPTINGSGDKYPALLPLALKVAAKTIGFELVNTQPISGPTGVLPYMDYVYAGSKQPYGATPAYDAQHTNPGYGTDFTNHENQPGVYTAFGLPSAFKAQCVSLTDGTLTNFYAWRQDNGATAKLKVGSKLTAATDFVVEFIGLSRIDGDPMLKVISGTKSLGEYFQDYTAESKDGLEFTSEDGVALKVKYPRLISMLEDNVQGFTGSGERDKDPWYGTYQDGMTLYEPMSRGTGEMTAPRQLSLQLFTKHIQVGTVMVGCSVTQEQVTDLQKQWGIDVVKMVENAGINELTNVINRHITSRLFGLGWKNHCKLVEVEGPSANLNMTFSAAEGVQNGTKVLSTPAFAIPQGDAMIPSYDARTDSNEPVCHQVNVALPMKPVQVADYAHFENRDTLIKRIANNILLASNWIQQRGRYGAGTFVVTNITIASALQSNAHYTFSPIDNNINQNAGQLYPLGTMCGMTIYVDPLMGGYDNRVLVGRKGGKDEPGVYFCPYVLADVVRIISEGTMAPKLMIKSRYALVDAGFFPETQYLTFFVDMANL